MHVTIGTCNDCDTLKSLYDQVECTIIDMMSNKNINMSFNVSQYYSQEHMNRLRRYRRILYKKLFNPKYTCLSNQDIIGIIKHYVYRDADCSKCAPCFPELPEEE